VKRLPKEDTGGEGIVIVLLGLPTVSTRTKTRAILPDLPSSDPADLSPWTIRVSYNNVAP